MSRRNFILTMKMFKCIMVSIKHKLPMKQVMVPMPNRLHHYIELYVIGAISHPRPPTTSH